MKNADRFKLRFGKYRTPSFRLGAIVQDEVRGEVKIVGLSDTPIPWPLGYGPGGSAPVVYKALAKAVRKESNQAVAHWWGVTPQTVTKWRKGLGVDPSTAGTTALRSDHFNEPWGHRARRKAWAKARDPDRIEKIAASKRGKPRPASVIKALRKARLGAKASAETRARMRAAHKARGTYPPAAGVPWTAKEDALVRAKLPTAEIVKRTGRTVAAVSCRRVVLGSLLRPRLSCKAK